MGELDLIRWIRGRGLPGARPGLVRIGPGDDCAVLACPRSGWELLLKTDGIVEGVHFASGAPPRAVGHKALCRALSDIAAMGGEPVAAVVHASLNARHAGRWAHSLQQGLAAAAGRHGCPVVGGDVSGTPGPTTITASLLGRVPVGRALLRSSARPGDSIFVTGCLGGSILGRHLRFEPRLAEGRFLARRRGIGACIDISDGLTRDLAHLLRESGNLGAELSARAIPLSAAAHRLGGDRLGRALGDGEDYELLFTVRAGQAARLVRSWPFRTRLSEIGHVLVPGGGLWLRERGDARRRIKPAGWEHLRRG